MTFGAGAIFALSRGLDDVMVALKPPKLVFVPIGKAISKLKLVPADAEGVLVARILDISFGDL